MSKLVSNPTRGNQATTSELAGFIRQKKLLQEYVPFSAATLWRLVKAGKFPKPIKIASQITVWRKSDILAWENNPDAYCRNIGKGASS